MPQPLQRLAQPRTNVDELATFTFSYRRPHSPTQVSAWMLNRSADEAAFLTTAGDAPKVGERLELTEVAVADTVAADESPAEESHLPQFGRVVRLEGLQGTTRRVAIRFEPPPRSAPPRVGR
jgi:hypothetical protein